MMRFTDSHENMHLFQQFSLPVQRYKSHAFSGRPNLHGSHMSKCSTTTASSGGCEAQADWLGPKVGGRPALLLHSSNELGELPQWQWYDDSTINSVVAVTITMILPN